MPVLGVSITRTEKVEKFFSEINDKLGIKSKTPFYDGKVITDSLGYIVIIKVLYPRIYLLGYLTLIGGFILTGFNFYWGYIITGLILLSPRVFYSSFFYYLILRLGLFKKGIKETVRKI